MNDKRLDWIGLDWICTLCNVKMSTWHCCRTEKTVLSYVYTSRIPNTYVKAVAVPLKRVRAPRAYLENFMIVGVVEEKICCINVGVREYRQRLRLVYVKESVSEVLQRSVVILGDDLIFHHRV